MARMAEIQQEATEQVNVPHLDAVDKVWATRADYAAELQMAQDTLNKQL